MTDKADDYLSDASPQTATSRRLATKQEAQVPAKPCGDVSDAENNSPAVVPHTAGLRKGKGRAHVVRHGILSRHVLKALRGLGVNTRRLRQLERKFQAVLKPRGELAAMLFDRLWSCYLRLLLIAQSKTMMFAPGNDIRSDSSCTGSLREEEVPTLVLSTEPEKGTSTDDLPPGLFQQLALVQRYDRHFSRELYKALALLLVMRSGGEAGLEACVSAMLGLRKDTNESNK